MQAVGRQPPFGNCGSLLGASEQCTVTDAKPSNASSTGKWVLEPAGGFRLFYIKYQVTMRGVNSIAPAGSCLQSAGLPSRLAARACCSREPQGQPHYLLFELGLSVVQGRQGCAKRVGAAQGSARPRFAPWRYLGAARAVATAAKNCGYPLIGMYAQGDTDGLTVWEVIPIPDLPPPSPRPSPRGPARQPPPKAATRPPPAPKKSPPPPKKSPPPPKKSPPPPKKSPAPPNCIFTPVQNPSVVGVAAEVSLQQVHVECNNSAPVSEASK